MKPTLAILTAFSVVTVVGAVNTVSVTDGDKNLYGKTSGIAIDFDATLGLTAAWSPSLTQGRVYRVDSVSIFLGDQGSINEELYLGVYTTLNEQLGIQTAATLDGFLGVSDNTFNLTSAPLNTALTWTFNGIAPEVKPALNPGSGDDILYFILQAGTNALIDTGAEPVAFSRPFRRIDESAGSFPDHLSAVIHASANNSLSDVDVVPTRALEYEAQVTDIGAATPPDVPDPVNSAVVVTDGAMNNYGRTSGVAIDFDATTGLAATWTPGLAAGATYQVDSLTLFLGAQGLINENLYLGVYTGLDEQIGVANAAILSGFLGVSDNTINLATAPLDTALTWTFKNITPSVIPEINPGSGNDILYFILQTTADALPDTGAEPDPDSRPFRRIDEAAGRFSDHLSAVIHGSANQDLRNPDVVTTRSLEYAAQLNVLGLSYSAWISQFDTGGLDNRSDDIEPDGITNELEYYLGGNPRVDDSTTIMPMGRVVIMGASNVFEYVYRRRTDNAELNYDLCLATSLTTSGWTNISNTYEVSVGSTEDLGVESVTNHIPIQSTPTFLKLDVTEN